jgi:alkanesulfonate monooxygenase SsuD/methylene tetrahydromethanopterin reductase-like flavin-dependent oxidoreductase (luciferase family)
LVQKSNLSQLIAATGKNCDKFGVAESPSPTQRPSPPIIVGGHVRAAFARAARLGDGWFGWDLDVDQTVRAVAALDEARGQVAGGRGRLEVTIAVAPGQPVTPGLTAAYAQAGVDRLILRPADFTGSEIDELIERTAGYLVGADGH